MFQTRRSRKIANNLEKYYKEWIEKKLDKKTGLPKKYLDGSEKQRTIRPSQKGTKINSVENKE